MMRDTFNQAAEGGQPHDVRREFNDAAHVNPQKPEEFKPEMHLRPDPLTVEAVHSALGQRGLGHVSPQLRDEDIAQEFRRRMLVRQSFNRAGRGLENEHGPDLSR